MNPNQPKVPERSAPGSNPKHDQRYDEPTDRPGKQNEQRDRKETDPNVREVRTTPDGGAIRPQEQPSRQKPGSTPDSMKPGR